MYSKMVLNVATHELEEVPLTPAEIAEIEAAGNPPEPIIVVFAVDLWSRMTDAEVDAVEAAMAEQPARIRNIFKAANSYRSDHELWPLLVTIATTLFSAERAAVILAPSETVPA